MLHLLLLARRGCCLVQLYVLALKASPPDVEMAGLGALRFGGESALVPGCLCDGTGTLYRMFSVV